MSSKHSASSSADASAIPIGDVGYRFEKYFKGYGLFWGTVVQIRPGAKEGKDRRCHYDDGDQEDLSIDELRQLAHAASKTSKSKQKSKKRGAGTVYAGGAASGNSSDGTGKGAKKKKKTKLNATASAGGAKKISRAKGVKKAHLASGHSNDLFAGVEDLLPIDRAAEATLVNTSSTRNSRAASIDGDAAEADEEAERQAWLEEVAMALGASDRGPNKSRKKASTLTSRSESRSMCESRSMSPPPPRPAQFVPILESKPAATDQILPSTTSSVTESRSSAVPSDLRSATGPPGLLLGSAPGGSRSASPSSSVSMDCLISLADIPRGKRHGTKVFRAKDNRRVVGEVILEHRSGYVEVILGKQIEKMRLRTYVVAPDEYNVGDNVPSHLQLPLAPGQASGAIRAAAGKKGRVKKKEGEPQLCDQISSRGSIASSIGTDASPMRYSTKRAPGADNLASSQDTDDTVDIGDLFYWCCEKCTMATIYSEGKCSACTAKRSFTAATKLSPLLEVATVAAAGVESAEEARAAIPMFDRDAVPHAVLDYLILSAKKKTDGSDEASKKSPPPSQDLKSYFSWICGYCTFKNSFKVAKCGGCKQRRGAGSTCSTPLDIATKAAAKAHSVGEAMNEIPEHQRKSIPESVLSGLVTCIAVVGNRKKHQHRCRNPKAPNADYCSYHCNDPLLLTSGKVCGDKPASIVEREDSLNNDAFSHENITSTASSRDEKAEEMESRTYASLCTNLSQFLAEPETTLTNNLRWNVRSTEDAILAQEDGPFPLGLLVRRFFPKYGFHDGRIIKALRQNWLDPRTGERRPVLVYRLLYNDGDREDLISHEINSLRQIYDRCNVDSLAHPSLQIRKGSVFETRNTLTPIVMVEGHRTPSIPGISPEEGGIVGIKYCQRIGDPWTSTEITLEKLQTIVVRMLPDFIVVGPAQGLSRVEDEEILPFDTDLCMEDTFDCEDVTYSMTAIKNRSKPVQTQSAPLLEWPGVHAASETSQNQEHQDTAQSGEKEDAGDNNDDECAITSELWLTRTAEKSVDAYDGDDDDEGGDGEDDDTSRSNRNQCCHMDDESNVRACLSRPQSGWDPAGALPYVRWDPFRNIVCDICKIDRDDHQILLCDDCCKGFHMYCVRPVLVNIPTTEWFCSDCKRAREQNRKPFSSFLDEMEKDPSEALKFLQLPFGEPNEFFTTNKDGLDLFNPTTKPHILRKRLGSTKSAATAKIGPLSFSFNVKPNDFVIPRPPLSLDGYNKVLSSWVAAMKYVGMTSYYEDLQYIESTESMNDCTLDVVKIEPLSRRLLDIFKEFKENLRKGALPPIIVVHDPHVGFTVEALEPIKKHTLIAEYIGEVTTIERSNTSSSSDSLMMLLDTNDDATSLIIDPTRTGNIARFLSGINNRSNLSKRKANVRTRRFALDGRCRVALFTAKNIEAGEKLHYDYNAGVEGRSMEEWGRSGFYDTRHFF